METIAFSNDKFYKLAQWSILLLAFLLPFWFLPTTLAPVEFNKVLLVSVLVMASLVFYLAHAVLYAKISLVSHRVFIFIVGALLFWFLSSLFSGVGPQSMWGVAAETTSFFNIFVLFLLSWLIAVLFSDTTSLKKLFLCFAAGFVIFAILAFVSIFGMGKFLGGVFSNQNFNTIGSWNSIGLSASFFLIMIYTFFARDFSGTKKWILGILFVFFIFLVALISFPLSWVFLAFFALIYLSYSIWRRNVDGSAFLLSILLLSLSVFGFTFKSVVPNIFGISAPIEVGVSHAATFQVVKEALKDNIFLGNGPSSFKYIWDMRKPADVNRTVFWETRFDVGSSYLLSMLGEIGMVGWVLFLGFLGYLWYLGLNLVSGGIKNESLFLSTFFLFSFTILMWILYPVEYTLLAFGFLSIGFLLASLRIAGSIKMYDILIFGEGPMGFVSAMAAVLLMIAGLFGFYISGTKYAGQLLFSKAVAAFSQNNLDLAEKKLLSAFRLDSRNSVYMNSLSQIYNIKSQLVLQDRGTPAELLNSRFKDALDKAIAASQEAIRLSPMDFEARRGLGNIYGVLVSLNIEGSRDAALTHLDEAIKRSPKNPSLFRDRALIYISEAISKKDNSFLDSAQKELEMAVELKPDYAAAHFLLAQIFDAKGNLTEAQKRGESAALISPNDVGALFQLGLLYYKADRLEEAEIVLKRTVAINPNYSNARYFLGLIYDKTKRKNDAISEFEKISALNPGNDEVENILSNLRSEKSALFGISPPGPSPEERKEAPVKDNKDSSSFGQ